MMEAVKRVLKLQVVVMSSSDLMVPHVCLMGSLACFRGLYVCVVSSTVGLMGATVRIIPLHLVVLCLPSTHLGSLLGNMHIDLVLGMGVGGVHSVMVHGMARMHVDSLLRVMMRSVDGVVLSCLGGVRVGCKRRHQLVLLLLRSVDNVDCRGVLVAGSCLAAAAATSSTSSARSSTSSTRSSACDST